MENLHAQWQKELEIPFSGWDFSHLNDRWIFEYPPWSYRKLVRQRKEKSAALLDMGTGGGEFLASLAPLPKYTAATEGWPPNLPVAQTVLKPLGVNIVECNENDELPFKSGEFDTVLNRHSAFNAAEVFRVLQPGGLFLTQQIGGKNLNDLAGEFNTDPLYRTPELVDTKKQIQAAGFNIRKAEEWQGKIEFKDVGAIVYFIKAIPWTVPGFDIEKNLHHLEQLQNKLDAGGKLVFIQERFLFEAEKPR